ISVIFELKGAAAFILTWGKLSFYYHMSPEQVFSWEHSMPQAYSTLMGRQEQLTTMLQELPV
ncbi:MAG TPA: hypothetical protein DIU08_11520, partial [Ktedonobacter sp.]|nr:hypothetical protein [Ktedonobacter sp.]